MTTFEELIATLILRGQQLTWVVSAQSKKGDFIHFSSLVISIAFSPCHDSQYELHVSCLFVFCLFFSATTTSFSLLLYFQVRFPTLFFYRVLESHKFIRTRKLICFFVLFCLPLQSRRRHRTGYFPRDHRRKNRIQINHKLKKKRKKYNTKWEMGNKRIREKNERSIFY